MPWTLKIFGVVIATGAAVLLSGGAASAAGPSRAVAKRYAHRTYVVDAAMGRRRFALAGGRVAVHAIDGSTVTAFPIVIADSGDGSGQAVLLFRDRRFLGWDSAYDTLHLSISSRGDAIRVRYGAYRGDDPFCCPSAFKTVSYRWNGRRIVADATPPLIYGRHGNSLHLEGAAGRRPVRSGRFHGDVAGVGSGPGHAFMVGDGLYLRFRDGRRSFTSYRVCWSRSGASAQCWRRTTGRRGRFSRIFTAAPGRAGEYRVRWRVHGRTVAGWQFSNAPGDEGSGATRPLSRPGSSASSAGRRTPRGYRTKVAPYSGESPVGCHAPDQGGLP